MPPTAPPTVPPKTSNPLSILNWFASLSPLERVTVTSISDRAWIETWLRFSKAARKELFSTDCSSTGDKRLTMRKLRSHYASVDNHHYDGESVTTMGSGEAITNNSNNLNNNTANATPNTFPSSRRRTSSSSSSKRVCSCS